jgi:voltage-gated potassium channel
MKNFWFGNPLLWNVILVLSVLIYAFIVPVLPGEWGPSPSRITFSLIFLSGTLSLDKRKGTIIIFSSVALVMEWVSGIFDLTILAMISRGLNVTFFLIVVGMLLHQMTTARIVNAKVILGSISGYLLIGIIYSIVIVEITYQDSGAFSVAGGPVDPLARLSESMYFGFVTLATLGYGDIVPLKPYSRSLTTFITISGQLYVAIIIAMLVGKFAARQSKENEHEES